MKTFAKTGRCLAKHCAPEAKNSPAGQRQAIPGRNLARRAEPKAIKRDGS